MDFMLGVGEIMYSEDELYLTKQEEKGWGSRVVSLIPLHQILKLGL